ncbi:MAG TPA: molybdopterin-dependent oxidoreductase [Candidatus Dormibacteraeota bacterium]|nr:molybdopterin-dependent oxidoreductase [Candidatus Dormibacteraeota bacterium]
MGRRANAFLLGLMGMAFLTGWLAFGLGTAPARWSLVVHATSGVAVVLLTPWKSAAARHGMERRRRGWWASIALAVLVLASVVAGIAHSTGLLRSWGDWTAITVHVGAALLAVPLALWHVVARPVVLRRTDFARRRLLQGGAVLAGAAGLYAASEGIVRLGSLPGSRRRFTGSYDTGAFDPGLLPATSWLLDGPPAVDRGHWRLTVRDGTGLKSWSLAELARFDDRLDATLDCTGGFYSTQAWAGARLDRLISDPGDALSFEVRSSTGYARRFPVEDLGRLLLATRLGGVELDAGHGFPLRLVAPDRRGFWWVKWVASIHLDATPAWWQLPFPIQ